MKFASKFMAAAAVMVTLPSLAHHSYAMFDTSKSATVSGTAAKFEWNNPHVFVWVYVPDKAQASGYQLYAFESGSLVLMARQGWDRESIQAGEKLTIEYFPLRDGRPGGVLIQLTHADGHVSKGDPFGQQLIERIRERAKGAT
jgi:hypothetical protein